MEEEVGGAWRDREREVSVEAAADRCCFQLRGISVETNAHIDLEPVQKQQVGGTAGVETEVRTLLLLEGGGGGLNRAKTPPGFYFIFLMTLVTIPQSWWFSQRVAER